jgi:uncharacterized surface protein with fasciclin (FAS1) repeats
MKKICLLILAVLLLQACIKKDDMQIAPVEAQRSLAVILQNNINFTMIYGAMERAGMDDILTGKAYHTLIIPGDNVLRDAGITGDSLQKMDIAVLKRLLNNLIVPGRITSDSVPQTIDYPYTNLNGSTMYFSVPVPGPDQYQPQGTLHINGATAIRSNILASNGVIQAMDRLITEPSPTVRSYLEQTAKYSFFVRGLKNFGLLDQLDGKGPFVVMAPTNDAFINHGYDSLMVEQLDTVMYKKWLMSSYILHTNIFFKTDFSDAPMQAPYHPMVNPPVILTDDYAVVFSGFGLGLTPFNYMDITLNPKEPYWGNAYIYGDQINMDDPDHLALNGVVHGNNGLLAWPDSDSLKIR